MRGNSALITFGWSYCSCKRAFITCSWEKCFLFELYEFTFFLLFRIFTASFSVWHCFNRYVTQIYYPLMHKRWEHIRGYKCTLFVWSINQHQQNIDSWEKKIKEGFSCQNYWFQCTGKESKIIFFGIVWFSRLLNLFLIFRNDKSYQYLCTGKERAIFSDGLVFKAFHLVTRRK